MPEIKQRFTKYFKEICGLDSDQHFSFKCFPNIWSCYVDNTKMMRTDLGAVERKSWVPELLEM